MHALLEGLKAVAEPTRLRLLALLTRAELTVTEITQVLKQSQPRVSRHLKLMVEAGLLRRFPEGTWVFYRLAEDGEAAGLARAVTALIDADDPVLSEDTARLETIRKARADEAAAYFAANASHWDEIRTLYLPEDAVERAIAALLGEKRIGTLLDLGTGTGRILEVLSPLAERAIGIDTSHEMLGMARANLERAGVQNVQVRYGNILRLDPGALGVVPQADVAVLHHVLHFFEHPQEVVVQAARLLAPGGRMLIADFAPHGLEQLRESHAHRRLGFADREVEAWAQAAGLSLVETRDLPPAGTAQLTVKLWLLEKPKGAATRRAGEAA
ncbi:2-methoxy-6-polyprenyl-1,4-benzoquinol methylase, mitochondrial [Alphaproteobacteria bacterium SO-S41]|nr:2-methoxy-6-polyprenyl-1,4-benzoquinol methylase, mitochondrial [Alphaproteobacteria bacterium SO-S41]